MNPEKINNNSKRNDTSDSIKSISLFEKFAVIIGPIAPLIAPIVSTSCRLRVLSLEFVIVFLIYILSLIVVYKCQYFLKLLTIPINIVLLLAMLLFILSPVSGKVLFDRDICFKPSDGEITISLWYKGDECDMPKEKINVYVNGDYVASDLLKIQNNRIKVNLASQPIGVCTLSLSAHDERIKFKNDVPINIGFLDTFEEWDGEKDNYWQRWIGAWYYDYLRKCLCAIPSNKQGGAFIKRSFAFVSGKDINIILCNLVLSNKDLTLPSLLLGKNGNYFYKVAISKGSYFKTDYYKRSENKWLIDSTITSNIPLPEINERTDVINVVKLRNTEGIIIIENSIIINKFTYSFMHEIKCDIDVKKLDIALGSENKANFYLKSIKWCQTQVRKH